MINYIYILSKEDGFIVAIYILMIYSVHYINIMCVCACVCVCVFCVVYDSNSIINSAQKLVQCDVCVCISFNIEQHNQ